MSKVVIRLGKEIRRQRVYAGLTQEELADKAKLHNTYIGQIERGEKNATVETVAKIANALKIPVADLFPNRQTKSKRTEKDLYALLSNLSVKDEKLMTEIVSDVLKFRT